MVLIFSAVVSLFFWVFGIFWGLEVWRRRRRLRRNSLHSPLLLKSLVRRPRPRKLRARGQNQSEILPHFDSEVRNEPIDSRRPNR